MGVVFLLKNKSLCDRPAAMCPPEWAPAPATLAYSLFCFLVSDLIFVVLFRRGSKNHVTLLLLSFCINIAAVSPFGCLEKISHSMGSFL